MLARFLPLDMPLRSEVVGGVWDRREVCTGALPEPESNPLNPPRYLYACLPECFSARYILLIRSVAGTIASGVYFDGHCIGAYDTGMSAAVFGNDDNTYYAAGGGFVHLAAQLVPPYTMYNVANGVITYKGKGAVTATGAPPAERDRKILCGTTIFTALYYRRELTNAEILEIVNYCTK